MTWVYGWPLYGRDAVKVAKRNNLLKDPNADEGRLAEAAYLWVKEKAGTPMLCCWVGDNVELVYAAYVDSRDRGYPPRRMIPDAFISDRQARRLSECMPLKDRGWYRYSDGTWTPWHGERFPQGVDMNREDHLQVEGYDDEDLIVPSESEEDGDDSSDGGSDEDSDENSDEDSDESSDEDSDGGYDESGDEDTESDDATVTDDGPSKLDIFTQESIPSPISTSAASDLHEGRPITEA